MKIGEVWKDDTDVYVKIIKIYEEMFDKNIEEWVIFDYCDKSGKDDPDEYQHGDSLIRYQFVKQYNKVYK